MKGTTVTPILAGLVVLSLAVLPAVRGQVAERIPILIEQKIVQITLSPENRDGINWELFKLYQKNRETTTGFFPLSDRARHRLDFRPMQKNIPPEQAENADFEHVEQTRVNQFDFGPIWEDTRSPRQIEDDTHFGSLRIYNFKTMMDYLRTLGEADVIFSRKWVSENGQQSMISSQPEITGTAGPTVEYWEGSRVTFRPEIIENHRIVFHLNSEAATAFYVDPALNPGLPVLERGGKEVAKLWRLFRLNTMGLVESGETAVFEDLREGKGILIFITPSILETQRKRVNS
ncbi:MAG: hypothetical protein V1789_04060 [PVC group bacterium]